MPMIGRTTNARSRMQKFLGTGSDKIFSLDFNIDVIDSVSNLWCGYIFTWEVNESILSLNSFSKPFMTDKTVIRTATPKVNPIIDIFEIIDMNDRLYLEKSNLYAKRIFINVL